MRIVMQPCVWRCAVLALALTEVRVHAADTVDTSPLLECPPPPADCTYHGEGYTGEYFFSVSGHHISLDFRDGDYFAITCAESLTVEDLWLPRFKEAIRVAKVTFEKCALPVNRPYAAVLAALNVTTFSELMLYELPTAVVTREHLADLQHLTRLELHGDVTADVSLAPGALSALSAAPALRHLILHSVRTPAGDLANVPPSLHTLHQWYLDLKHIYFNSPPNLTTLDVSERSLLTLNVSNATTLKVLSVSSSSTVIPEDALPLKLTHLILTGWNDTRPTPKTRCAQYQYLKMTGTGNEIWPVSLPDEWVASCGQLMELHMYHVPVNEMLPARLLAHARTLKKLTIANCNLHELPPGLLDDTSRLTSLDLSKNSLTTLPSGLFLHTTSLETLILSQNLLTSSVAGSLSAVTSLNILDLHYNKHLGDLCSGGSSSISVPAGTSPLKSLKSLRHLYLSNTRVTRICRDWRDNLINLIKLDLKNTNITVLNLLDLQFRRAKSNTLAMVFLKGNEFKLRYYRDEYLTAFKDQGGTKATVRVEGSLILDCNAYWTVMEFKRSKSTTNIKLPTFEKLKLDKIDVDTLTCDASKHCSPLALPRNCSCGVRDDLEHGSVVIAECAGAGLTSLPRLPAAEHKWRLHLAYNNITNITADRVSHIADVVELDLRNNLIKSVDGDIAAKLASVPLWLGGNQLECGCESFGMLMALVGIVSHLQDKVNVICVNGTPLADAPLKQCDTLTSALAVVLIVLLAITVAVRVMLAYRVGTAAKTFLLWLWWLPRRLESTDNERRLDAFVS